MTKYVGVTVDAQNENVCENWQSLQHHLRVIFLGDHLGDHFQNIKGI